MTRHGIERFIPSSSPSPSKSKSAPSFSRGSTDYTSSKKIYIEFDNLGAENYGYGVMSIRLGINGRRSGFKAIFYNNRFVTIVSERYEVIPNAEVASLIRRKFPENVIDVKYEDWRLYVVLEFTAKNGDKVGVMIRNSIDQTLALGVDFLLPVGNNAYAVWRMAYRRHTRGEKSSARSVLNSLPSIITAVIEKASEIKSIVKKAEDVKLTKEDVEELADAGIPQKYLIGLKYLAMKQASIAHAYMIIAQKIWKDASNKMPRKYDLFNKLNEWLLLRLGLEYGV